MLRHENKYIISLAAAEELRARLRAILRPDPHAGETGSYFIRSLYFDDIDCSAYHDKLAGVCDRAKWRIRFYNLDDSYIVLEKKEKFAGMTRKRSARIDRALAEEMMAGNFENCAVGKPLLREFHAEAAAGLMTPRITVDYDRMPFVATAGNVRVTLDLGLRTMPRAPELFVADAAVLPVLTPGEAVLEVKYDDFLPEYISEALECVPKARMAVSKYCLCLAAVNG